MGISFSDWAYGEGGLPNTWILNNIISDRYWIYANTNFYNDISMLNTVDYNWFSGDVRIGPSTGIAWLGEHNIVNINDNYIWNFSDTELKIDSNSEAYNAALDLSEPFTLNGVTYLPLPGMVNVADGMPDIGAYEFGESSFSPFFNSWERIIEWFEKTFNE